MDSGATCNLVSARVVARASLSTFSGTPVKLQQADGSPLLVSSYCDLQVAFEGQGPWTCTALVAPLLSCDVILGCPFMQLHSGRLEFVPELRLHLPLPSEPGKWTSFAARLGIEPIPRVMSVSPEVNPPFAVFQSTYEAEARAFAFSKCTFDGYYALLARTPDGPIKEVLKKYKVCFPDKLPPCLPPDRGLRNHYIELIPGVPLPQNKYYPVTEASRPILRDKIDQMVKAHILVPEVGNPRAVSAGFLVKGKKPRLVGDFRAINEATVTRAQDIPTVQDELDKLALAVWFSVVDAVSGFHQLRIRDSDQDLTTIATVEGRYHYTVTAMGLKNAPTDFQRAVEAPLRATGGYGRWLSNYIDDIQVYSQSLLEHAAHLDKTLGALESDLWCVAADKIQLAVRKIHLLGHWIQFGTVFPDPDYIKKVYEIPSPDTLSNKIKGLQCLLGLFGYYRRFISDFASLAVPLTQLLRKDTPWAWGEPQESARAQLSARLQSALDHGLRIFRGGLPTRISTDASGAGLGAVLEQQFESPSDSLDENDSWWPVAFHSTALSSVESRLLNYERELLAIFSACKKWLHYLQGTHFTVRCDCAVLKNLTTMSLTGRRVRVVNMLLFLRTLSFTWVHVPGKDNIPADAFSRLQEGPVVSDSDLLNDLPGTPSFVGQEFPHVPIDDEIDEYVASVFDGLVPEVSTDTDWVNLVECVGEGDWTSSSPPKLERPSRSDGLYTQYVSLVHDELRLSYTDQLPWDESASRDFLCFLVEAHTGNHPLEFDHLPTRLFPLPSENREGMVAPVVAGEAGEAPVDVPPSSLLWDYTSDPLFATTWARTSLGPSNKYRRDASGTLLLLKDFIVVPAKAVPTVLAELHVSYGHIARESLLRLVTDRGLWWTRRNADVRAFVDSCPTCRLKSASRSIVYGTPGSRAVLDKGQEIAVDFTHVLPQVGIFDAVLGIVDRTTRFTMWIPASQKWKSSDFIKAIVASWMSFFGRPRIVRSDNGPTFVSEAWVSYWRNAGCIVSHCSPYYPQGNGIVERSFRTLKDRLRSLQEDDRFTSWVDMLPYIQGAANSLSRVSLGGRSPAEVTFGFSPRWECLPSAVGFPPSVRSRWLSDNAQRDATLMADLRASLIDQDKKDRAKRLPKHRPWKPKVGDLVLVKRGAVAKPPSGSHLLLGFIGPLKVVSILDHNVEIMWNNSTRRVALAQLRPWGGAEGSKIQSSLEALWNTLSTSKDPPYGHDDPIRVDEPGIWPAPDLDSSDEDEEFMPPPPIIPSGVSVPGIIIPPTVVCSNVHEITSSNKDADGRWAFRGKTSDLVSATWYWLHVAEWVQHEWVITDKVLAHFRRRKKYKRMSEDGFMKAVDSGSLPGFLNEGYYSVPFFDQLCAAWHAFESGSSWPNSKSRPFWVSALTKAAVKHGLPSPCSE